MLVYVAFVQIHISVDMIPKGGDMCVCLCFKFGELP